MSSKPSTSKDAVKAEEKPKAVNETLNVLEEDDEFEEFAAAGKAPMKHLNLLLCN